MKNYILPFILLLAACQEEDPQSTQDPFVGSWHLDNPDLQLKVSFDIDEDLTFQNVSIEYPGISEALDYEVQLFERFAVNTGYEEIKVFGGGDQQWIELTMLHNRVHLKTRDMLEVYTMIIEMADSDPVTLQDQVFTKLP